jgi:Transposase DDE domain
MRHAVDPRQISLFDSFDGVFSPLARKRLEAGWQSIFRAVLLELMPVQALGEHYHPTLGRHTKELYSVAGLLFLQETFDWTNAAAVNAYLFHGDVQFALNLEPGIDELCDRTLERYRKQFIDDDLAAQTMHEVTGRLVELLDLDITRQRLDSTHVFSNMASFGRTRLLGVTVKRFLTQVKRHAPEAYEALPEALRTRYATSVGKLFAGKKQSPEQRTKTLQQVAEDVRDLIDRFAADASMAGRSSYQALLRVFADHCEIVADKVNVRPKAQVDSLQNPSDPDATYDGHKGQGYKLQIAETCGDSAVQLIVGALAQTAAEHDANALQPMLEQLQEQELLPESMLADTAFGSDENVRLAEAMNVELVSPVAGPKGDAKAEATASTADATPAVEPLSIDDFAIDERTGKVKACPAGKIPLQVMHDAESQTTTIAMHPEDCKACPFFAACPMQKKGAKFEMSYTDKQRRLEERRREQQTKPFQERYAKRSGMESTNSGLKRRLGLGQLRIRGMKAVAHALYLRVAGWNLLQATRSASLMAKVRAILAQRGLLGRFFARWFGWNRKSVAHWPTRPTISRALKLEPAW